MENFPTKTLHFEVSWGNIQDQIASMIHALAKGAIKHNEEIISIKLNYAGGYVGNDKVIPVECIIQKGVRSIKFG